MSRARSGLLAAGAAWLILLWSRTLRVHRLGWSRVESLRSAGRPIVYALLHGDSLLLLAPMRQESCAVLVSQSKDGDRATALLRSLGYCVARGSSSRGGARGMRQLLAAGAEGHSPAIAVDGPRGPAGSCGPGIGALAARTGSWIVPVAAASTARWRLPTWDRTQIPLPGSSSLLLFGRPICPSDLGGNRDDSPRQVAERLRALHRRAERLAGRSPAAMGSR